MLRVRHANVHLQARLCTFDTLPVVLCGLLEHVFVFSNFWHYMCATRTLACACTRLGQALTGVSSLFQRKQK
jgi:hypothetical protein